MELPNIGNVGGLVLDAVVLAAEARLLHVFLDQKGVPRSDTNGNRITLVERAKLWRANGN